MLPTDGKRPIPRSEYDSLEAQLARAQQQLSMAQEEVGHMTGYSDAGEHASYAASIRAFWSQIERLEQRLDAVFPSDAIEQAKAVSQSIDDIMAEAIANADEYRLEVWDGPHFVQELASGDGPLDAEMIAEQLRAVDTIGELRLIAGRRGSSGERCVSIHLLARPASNRPDIQRSDASMGNGSEVAPSPREP